MRFLFFCNTQRAFRGTLYVAGGNVAEMGDGREESGGQTDRQIDRQTDRQKVMKQVLFADDGRRAR